MSDDGDNQKTDPRHPWGDRLPDEVVCSVVDETPEAPGRVSTPSGDLAFLNVSGTPAEMAGDAGRRLGELVHRGPIPSFMTYLAHRLKESPIGQASKVVDWVSRRWATNQLADAIDGEFREAVEALAEASGIRRDALLRAYTLPETYLWFVGTLRRLTGAPRALGLGRPPLAGCTSAVVRPPGAETTLHARNLDYFGIEFWERAATVTFYRPDTGLDYVSVASAGIFGGGLTAMNRAGITLAVHQHFVDQFDLGGDPVGVAGDRAMRSARSIDEAVDVLLDHDPVAGWTYVLTEGDTGRVVVVEVAPDDSFVYELPEEEPRLGYSNVYWGPSFEETEIDVHPEYRRDARARERRALDLTGQLAAGDEAVGPPEMAEVLADSTNPSTGREELVGRSIASVHTVSSVVFEPEQRRVWVGSGHSPTSRSWFIPFEFHGGGYGAGGGPSEAKRPFHPCPGWDRRPEGQAFEHYREACFREREGESDKRLLILVEHALALDPEAADLHVLAGLLALRQGRARRAEGAFRRALDRVGSVPRRAEVTLYLGWAHDLQDEREAAVECFDRVLEMSGADGWVRGRARRARWWPVSASRLERLAVDFVHVGVV